MLNVISSETLPVSTSAVSLTYIQGISQDTTVTIHAEGSIRYWTSGKIPTSTDGIPLYDGLERTISAIEAVNFRAVRKDAVDAKIHVQYGRNT